MGQKDTSVSGPSGIQVFELTMDNPEDQDELNRRLLKPGDLNGSPNAQSGRATQGEPIKKKKKKRGRDSN